MLEFLLLGSFEGSTSFPATLSGSDSVIANALTIHENAWETVVEKAEKDKYYKYWQSFYYSLGLVMESEEYKKEYSEIGITYTTGEVEEKIRVCVAEIENEAEQLKAEGQIEEAVRKYDFIVNSLIEADWKNNEDIRKFEAKKSDIKAATQDFSSLSSDFAFFRIL